MIKTKISQKHNPYYLKDNSNKTSTLFTVPYRLR